jgi:hypothetical protein
LVCIDALLVFPSLTGARRTFFSFQVSEKCPSCGNLEAYSKEMQVR